MGQEDGCFAALAADPFERRFLRPPGVMEPEDWRALVLAAMGCQQTWGPELEPTSALEELAYSQGAAPGGPHEVGGFADGLIMLHGALAGCDARVWRPSGPLSDLLVGDRVDVRPVFRATSDPAAAADAWQTLCTTVRTPTEASLPWWLQATMAGSWDVGVTAPGTLAGVLAALEATGAITALTAWPGSTGAEHYGEDLAGLLAFLRRASDEGRWVLGTVAGS